MIIIWGQRHFGQADGFERYAECEQCNHTGWLKSYSTAVYFTMYYIIPLFPLGRKRIMDSCSHCKMHRELPLKRLKTIRQEAEKNLLSGNVEDNFESFLGEIANCGIHDPFDNFKQLSTKLERVYARNANALAALATVHNMLANYPEVRRISRLALTIDAKAPCRELLAYCLAQNGNVDEAWDTAKYVIEEKQDDRLGFLYLIVAAYLHHGQGAGAEEVLTAIENYDESVIETDNHQRFRADCQHVNETQQSIHYNDFKKQKRPRPISSGAPLWLPGLILTLIILFILSFPVSSVLNKTNNQSLTLINGTKAAYQVTINDQVYKLKGAERRTIALPEGEITYHLKSPLLTTQPKQANFKSSFSDKLFGDPVFVLNPDGCALLVKETVYYQSTRSAKRGSQSESDLSTGEDFYRFDDIDFPFRALPRRVRVDSGSSEVYRTRLYDYRASDEVIVNLLLSRHKKEKAKELLGRLFRLDIDNSFAIAYYYGLYMQDDAKGFIKMLEPGLKHKPIAVEWHRFYQNLIESVEPEIDLIKIYKEKVEANPKSGLLHYLYGRILPGREASHQAFHKAEQVGKPVGFGFHGLAFSYASSGEFKTALKFSNQAIEVDKKSPNFLRLNKDLQLACRNYNSLLKVVNKKRQADSFDFSHFEEQVRLLYLLDHKSEASSKRQQYERHFLSGNQSQKKQVKARVAALFNYLKGDYKAYAACMLESRMPGREFQNAAIHHNFDGMQKQLRELKSSSYRDYLVLYCLSVVGEQDPESCEEHLAYAADLLRYQGNHERRVAAAMLMGDEQLTAEELKHLRLPSDDKKLVACALGLRHPHLRKFCFDIAKTHNFKRVFPYGIIEHICQKTKLETR